MTTTCLAPSCDKPIPDTAYICSGCTNRLRYALTDAGARVDDARHTIVFGTVTEAHNGPGTITAPRALHGPFHSPSLHDCQHRSCWDVLDSQWRAQAWANAEHPQPNETPSPFNVTTSETLWEFQNTITTWARHVIEERGITLKAPVDSTAGALAVLADNVTWLMHRPEADQAHDELTHALTQLDRAVDVPAPKMYAGPCDVCARDLYAKPGDDFVECKPCDIRHEMTKRRTDLLERITDRLCRASELAHILTGLGTPVTRKQIDQWHARQRIAPASRDRLGRPLYRIKDVLAVANAPRATRGKRTA